MKKTFFVVLFLLLSACTVSSSSLEERLDARILAFQQDSVVHRPNIRSRYYSYYLPSDMQRLSTDGTGILLQYADITILMNINIADVINQEQYVSSFLLEDGFYAESDRIYQKRGVYADAEENIVPFLIEAYTHEKEILLVVYTSQFHYYAYCYPEEAETALRHILLIAKSALCESENVIADFSDKITIDYEKKQVDLFETIIPKNGNLSDMIIGEETPAPSESPQPSETQTEDIIGE
ncbi:MAG: hypothetical protein IKE21_06685 [Erysipelotrichaceae bacterium]|nr:hypothetical protein [Erysipelotrichaceae bacterium]